jgi:hypothetical protein
LEGLSSSVVEHVLSFECLVDRQRDWVVGIFDYENGGEVYNEKIVLGENTDEVTIRTFEGSKRLKKLRNKRQMGSKQLRVNIGLR